MADRLGNCSPCVALDRLFPTRSTSPIPGVVPLSLDHPCGGILAVVTASALQNQPAAASSLIGQRGLALIVSGSYWPANSRWQPA
jgi:hypothetical protein